jgi:cytochrome c
MRKSDISKLLVGAIAGACLHGAANAQDATAGKAVFAQCASCHTIDGSSLVGPSLKGITGRAAGALPEFRYSRAMKSSGKTWDDASLDAFIAAPQNVIPGNVMPFSGIADAKQRADLVAYLKTIK